jgi:hypothetical protein
MDILKGFVRDPITQAVINKDEKNYKDHIFKMELYKELGRTKALLANSEEKN